MVNRIKRGSLVTLIQNSFWADEGPCFSSLNFSLMPILNAIFASSEKSDKRQGTVRYKVYMSMIVYLL
jgi:hypothetical protein